MIYGNSISGNEKDIEEKVNKLFGISEDQSVFDENKVYVGDGFCITVDGSGATDRDFDKMPYFKVYKTEKVTSSTPCARFTMKDGEELIHDSPTKKSLVELNLKDMKKLKNIINNKKPNINKKLLGDSNSVWDGMIKIFKAKYPNIDTSTFTEPPDIFKI